MRRAGYKVKVDDCCRVVIPKKLRQKFRIDAGDDLEICTQGTCVCYRKWKAADGLIGMFQEIEEAMKEEDRLEVEVRCTVSDCIKTAIAALKENKR